MFAFSEYLGALLSCYVRFEICLFALLPTNYLDKKWLATLYPGTT